MSGKVEAATFYYLGYVLGLLARILFLACNGIWLWKGNLKELLALWQFSTEF